MSGRVKVFVRVRPPNAQEASSKNGGAAPALAVFPAAAEVEVVDASALACVTGGSKRFTFDGVFGADGTQETVFESIGRPTVERVLAGFNGTILAYGQTSSGKTHTMMGPGGGAAEALRSEQRGLTPRVLDLLMGSLAAAPEAEASWTVQMSACELYNEELFDLCLGDGDNGGDAGGELRIREDRTSGRGVYVENLKTTSVRTAADALQVMMRAAERKHMGGTNSNETSSRSHTIVQLMVEQVNHVDGGTRTLSQLFLVDLAGSERLDKTGAVGQRLKEAQNINLSLTLLGNVINKLTDGKALHIPYRDSKLTRLLQDSLGGNAMTTLLCACSPASFNGSETVSTLQFAMRAKRIENKPRANKILSDDELRRAYNKALDEIRVLEETLCSFRNLHAGGQAPSVSVASPSSPPAAGGGTGAGVGFRGVAALQSQKKANVIDDAPAIDEAAQLRETIASLLSDIKASKEENQRTDAQAAELRGKIDFYVSRDADLNAKVAEWKGKYDRERLACDSWARKFQQLIAGGGDGAASATMKSNATAIAVKAKPPPPKASHSGPVRKGTSTANPKAPEATAPSTPPMPDDDAAPPPPSDPIAAARAAEEREMRALVRERMLLAQVDELRERVNASLKYPILLERANKELEIVKEDGQRRSERQAQEFDAMLQRQDREIAELQMKLDARAAAQERALSQQSSVTEEVLRLRGENDILHEENRANARRLVEFATRAEKLQQELNVVTADRDRLRRDIESSNISDDLKTKLLGTALALQRSNFRKKLLECFARDE